MTPFDAISRILRTRLRGEALPPDFQSWLIDAAADDIAWVKTASRHRIGPALGACLEDLDLFDCLEADLGFYFRNVRDGNEEQNDWFLEELSSIGQSLNEIGIEPCLLKGAVSLVDDVFPDPSWRFMNDLDLLVPEDRVKNAWDRLIAIGYQPYEEASIEGRAFHHLPALWHPERWAYVEIHHQTARPRYSRILPADDLLRRASTIDEPGMGRILLPHAEDRAVLLIAHAQIFNSYDRYGMFRLTDLVEFDRLSTRFTLDIDAILDRFRREGWAHQCMTFMILADRLLKTPAATGLPITARARFAAQRLIWQQHWRWLLTANIVAGWIIRTLQHALIDGDLRFTRKRMVESVSNNKRIPFHSLKQTLQDYT